ncbi:hypothetical protein [Aminobacter carboxidus]|uniref:Uncharacterized protein n=1 Tax=Aminobacter carboxidus TaxID=376165 RepID=A0ABR9GJT6_9HYPH|nr:hypothetical protein [Aminobacter carboxidus]MBE1203884.1 hypothetical protein [Aminobacter carboxidus]
MSSSANGLAAKPAVPQRLLPTKAIAATRLAQEKHFESLANAHCHDPRQSWHACAAFDAAKMSRAGKSVPKRKLFLVVFLGSGARERSTDDKARRIAAAGS